MRNNKTTVRLLSFLCLFALLAGAAAPVLAYGGSSNWAKAELDAMDALGLIPEMLQEKAALTDNITRLEMCAIAVQAFEVYIGQEIVFADAAPFTDTDSPIVAKAYAVGLTKGYEDRTFRPDNLLTREEFFTFVYHFLMAVAWEPDASDFADISHFPDAASVASWAQSAARLVVGLGIVKGDERGLAPKVNTTCEQALAMFYRTYLVLTANSFPIPSEPTDPSEPDLPFEEKYPNPSNWAKVELSPMDEQGLIPRLLLGRDMQSDITRLEMCYIAMEAYLALRPDAVPTIPESPFSDVDDEIVTFAYELGIVSGFPDGTFEPHIPITREQFYKITVNFLLALGYDQSDYPDTDLSRFNDTALLHDYAKAPARLLVHLGILKGDGYGLCPRDTTQCQQAMALFFRSYNYLTAWLAEHPAEPPVTDRSEAEALVEFALQFVGYDYVWGGRHPDTGFDCSGLVYYVYRHFGYAVDRTATDQWYYEDSWEVSLDELLPGDLLFFSKTHSVDDIYHIGIYVGDGQYLHAANSQRGVVVDSIYSDYFESYCFAARRIIP